MEFRVGTGYDAHRLTAGRKLILGGMEIPHETGLLGHSDADVLAHAVMDALLGAAGLEDIGAHFPDTDERYRDISSLLLLQEVTRKIKDLGWSISNVDAVVAAQRPRLRPFIGGMRTNLSEAMEIPREKVGVKATTTEGMGFEGREEGISAQSVCLIFKA
jgi:2-C-methyl-D-erythritol 2,4-cyclodiphosphate synthase